MALALEQVRRIRGGAQSHLMRCSNQAYYVVKFQNNPQGLRILANELLGTRLAARLGLSVADPEVVEVRAELIAHTEDLVIQLRRGRAPCKAGKQFGSRYPGNLADGAVYDFLPDEQLCEVTNLEEFCGMLCSTNGPATPTGGRRYFSARRTERATVRAKVRDSWLRGLGRLSVIARG
jgi:hypothetical protein